MQLIVNRLPPSVLLNLAFVAVVFILDLATKLGTPVWILYVVAFFFMPANVPQHYPLTLAGVCTLLMLVGYLLSPEGITSEPLSQRGIVIIILWVYALVLSRRKNEDEDKDED